MVPDALGKNREKSVRRPLNGGRRTNRTRAYAFLLAVCLLLWQLSPWAPIQLGPQDAYSQEQADRTGSRNAQAGGSQQLQPLGVLSSEPAKGGMLEAAAVKKVSMMYAQVGQSPSVAAAGGPHAYPSPAAGPGNTHPSRSEARKEALMALSGHLPAAYFDRNKGDRAAATATDFPAQPGSEPARNSAQPTGKGKDGKVSGAIERATSAKPGVSSELVSYEDLPLQIRDALSLSISMLVYSKNVEERLIAVDGYPTMREGQETAGLKVEKIDPGEAIFSYQGYRFRKTVRGG